MATERQLQFRVGALVLIAASICFALVIRFGDTKSLWKKQYSLTIQLENSAGLYPSAPVTLSGLTIGSVKRIELNPTRGVNVYVEIQQDIRLPSDSRAVVTRSLLGESAVEFVRGEVDDSLSPGDQVVGHAAIDPLVMIQRLETHTLEALNAFGDTTQEWQQVAKNINGLMDTKRGNLDQVVERAADSLYEFTNTMKSANKMIVAANGIVADPETQRAMKDSLTTLPRLVNTTKDAIDEIRQTIGSTRNVLDSMNRNLVNLSKVTEPVGQRGEQMVANIDQLLTDLNRFIRVVNQKDGSLQQFIANPSLYNNLDRVTQQLVVLMKHLEPVAKDLREFGDKVARNPELLGVSGAIRSSNGLKDQERIDKKSSGSTKLQSTRANNSNSPDR